MKIPLIQKIRRYLAALQFKEIPCYTRTVNTTDEAKNTQIITYDTYAQTYFFTVQRMIDTHVTRSKAYTIRQALRQTVEAHMKYLNELNERYDTQMQKLEAQKEVVMQNIADWKRFAEEVNKVEF